MSDNCPFCGAAAIQGRVNPKWVCNSFQNPGIERPFQSDKCRKGQARAEGYAAGLRDAARAVWELRDGARGGDMLRRFWYGVAVVSIETIAKREGISTEDWGEAT